MGVTAAATATRCVVCCLYEPPKLEARAKGAGVLFTEREHCDASPQCPHLASTRMASLGKWDGMGVDSQERVMKIKRL